MSYNNRRGNSNNFSVTSSRDGSRSFSGNHDDRWRQPSYSGRGPKNRGYRGNRGGGYKNFNASSARYHRNRHDGDTDGDISMSGDSAHQRSRGRYRDQGRRGGGRGRGRGRQVNRDERWFKVMVPFGANMSREELYELIRSESEGTAFNPLSYHTADKRAYFLVKGYSESENLRLLSRRITKPDGHKLVLHVSPCDTPQNSFVSDEEKEKLKLCMSSRYDPSTKLLNLSSLHTDDSLTKDGIFLYLNKPVVMDAVARVVQEYIPEVDALLCLYGSCQKFFSSERRWMVHLLAGLDLSSNKMLSLGHMAGLVKAAPGLTALNLGKNQMRNISELDKVKDWANVLELMLEGNDFCRNFKNQKEYVSAVRKSMPKVIKLDGNDLPPPVSFSLETQALPASKGSFFLEEKWKNLIITFVKEFFPIYDSDSRRNLIAAYSENAQFSMCVSRNPTMDRQDGFKAYIRESRNLKKIGHHDSDDVAKKIKSGVLGVVSALESLPKTTHDMNSFTADITHAAPNALCFVLHGVFKESENQVDKPTIRSFSRTFVTVPKGDSISIINDMLTISNAGLEQSRNAFKGGAPTPSSSPASNSQTGGTPSASVPDNTPQAAAYSPEQKKMVERFSTESGMNLQFSLNCLQENAWNYQQAGQIFTDLKNQGKIPPEAFIKT